MSELLPDTEAAAGGAELDLMAKLAEMTSRDRFGGWKREPFTNKSRRHISVWEKTEALPNISATS